MASWDLAEERHLLLDVDALNRLHREVVVPQEAVHAQQLHQREVAQETCRLAREWAAGAGLLVFQVALDLRFWKRTEACKGLGEWSNGQAGKW